jgi:pyrimidine operon attenuation protein/uracil phosphoribosyltransferase
MAALPDAEALCASLAASLSARIGPSSAMIGIHTGGAFVAERLHAALGMKEPLGFLDIAFYRDDYDRKGLARDPKRSKIPFDVAGKDLLLVDDVLYTGRTGRAAVNELFDYGRPASIALVVLVERDGRQLPICAQYAGAHVDVPAESRLRLKRNEQGRLSLELERAA